MACNTAYNHKLYITITSQTQKNEIGKDNCTLINNHFIFGSYPPSVMHSSVVLDDPKWPNPRAAYLGPSINVSGPPDDDWWGDAQKDAGLLLGSPCIFMGG